VNEALEGEPELVNSEAYGAGWIAKVKMSGADSVELMSDDEYTLFLEE